MRYYKGFLFIGKVVRLVSWHGSTVSCRAMPVSAACFNPRFGLTQVVRYMLDARPVGSIHAQQYAQAGREFIDWQVPDEVKVLAECVAKFFRSGNFARRSCPAGEYDA